MSEFITFCVAWGVARFIENLAYMILFGAFVACWGLVAWIITLFRKP